MNGPGVTFEEFQELIRNGSIKKGSRGILRQGHLGEYRCIKAFYGQEAEIRKIRCPRRPGEESIIIEIPQNNGTATIAWDEIIVKDVLHRSPLMDHLRSLINGNS